MNRQTGWLKNFWHIKKLLYTQWVVFIKNKFKLIINNIPRCKPETDVFFCVKCREGAFFEIMDPEINCSSFVWNRCTKEHITVNLDPDNNFQFSFENNILPSLAPRELRELTEV